MEYLEKEVKDKIIELGKAYMVQEKRRNAFAKRIEEYVLSNASEHNLLEPAFVGRMLCYLSGQIRLRKIEDKFGYDKYDLRRMGHDLKEEPLEKDVIRSLKKMRTHYVMLCDETNKADDEINEYIWTYIAENKLENNAGALKQIEDIMPPCVGRVFIIARRLKAEDSDENRI